MVQGSGLKSPKENPACPAYQKADATKRRDSADLSNVSNGQDVETAGEKYNSCEEEAEAKRAVRRKGHDEKGHSVYEMIVSGRFPVVGSPGFGQQIFEGMSTEGSEKNSEKKDNRGNSNVSFLGHEE